MILLLAAFIVVILPLIAGLSIGFWFWRIPLFSKVRKKAQEFDSMQVSATALTLRDLRRQGDLGDKIVVTHHLTRLLRAVTDSITDRCVIGTVVTGFLAMLVVAGSLASTTASTGQVQAVGSSSPAPSSGPTLGQAPGPTLVPPPTDPTSQEFLQRLSRFYYVPLAGGAALLMAIVSLRLIYVEVAWYRESLE